MRESGLSEDDPLFLPKYAREAASGEFCRYPKEVLTCCQKRIILQVVTTCQNERRDRFEDNNFE